MQGAMIERLEAELASLSQSVSQLQLRIAAQESGAAPNSKNSSMPPSSDGPSVSRGSKAASNKKRGAQPGHKGQTRAWLAADETVRYEPSSCTGCGDMFDADAASAEDGQVWQVAELPELKAHVTHHVASGRRCRCGRVTHASIPKAILAHGYGPRLSALLPLLTTRYGMSKRNVQELCGDVLGITLSTGTVCALTAEFGEALKASTDEALEYVRAEPIVYADETGWKTEKKAAWLWVASSALVTVFLANQRRSKQAAQELLGADFAGTLVTDRLASYDFVALTHRQLCLAHLLRDAQGMSERNGEGAAIGAALVVVFRKGIALFHDHHAALITEGAMRASGAFLQNECRTLLAAGAILRVPSWGSVNPSPLGDGHCAREAVG
jgi:transposase